MDNDSTPNTTMNTVNTKTEAGAVANVVKRLMRPELVALGDDDDTKVLVLAEGLQAKSLKPFLDEYLTAPERRKGSARLGDLGSFIAWTTRFADVHSVLFASPDPKSPQLCSVLDYHEATAEGAPRFGQHRGIYSFPLSDEWLAWTAGNAKSMDQRKFAEFIEDRIIDILGDPSAMGARARNLAEAIQVSFAPASRLLELSRGMSIRVAAKVTSAQNLATGEVQVCYATTHEGEGGGSEKIPGAFLIGIPVFRNGERYELPVRLRYRLNEGALSWFYEIHGADRVFEHAFNEACEKAAHATGLPLFVGVPEVC
jgi:uncharacterized protein YfdQ (DUF2303 family)